MFQNVKILDYTTFHLEYQKSNNFDFFKSAPNRLQMATNDVLDPQNAILGAFGDFGCDLVGSSRK